MTDEENSLAIEQARQGIYDYVLARAIEQEQFITSLMSLYEMIAAKLSLVSTLITLPLSQEGQLEISQDLQRTAEEMIGLVKATRKGMDKERRMIQTAMTGVEIH